ncbi:MAG: PKD domain-containing protein [Bacteroidales bacterium]|jgi:gliding motility-associated-like protein
MFKKSYIIFTLFFLFTSNFVFSQQADDSTGCAPFLVHFTGVPGATNILWDFGDGAGSNINNPQHTYALTGNYVVKYDATVNSSPYSSTINIKVFGKPTPKFTTPDNLKGCIPHLMHFNDQSTGWGGSTIKNWQWTFGDGGGDNTNNPNPQYVYTLGGVFDVSLIVIDDNGCDSSIVKKLYISVSQKPTISVITNPLNLISCNVPFVVTYNTTATSNATQNKTLNYIWNFGNGQTSSSITPSPVITYTHNGSYTAKLIVTDINGCSDSVKKIISIGKPVASFNVGDTVCNPVTFINNSTPGTTAIWIYGDGTNGNSPFHTYTNSGFYNVKLTVISSGNCQDDTTRRIYVEIPTANFTFTPTYFCSIPASITLTNNSSPGTTCSWSFSHIPQMTDDDSLHNKIKINPSSSTNCNPVITIEKGSDTSQYIIINKSKIYATLTVTTSHGCTATLTKLIDTVCLPIARFMPDITYGCAPLEVNFSDSSRSCDEITNWKYIWGDGTTTSGKNVPHTFNNPGTYWVKLVITNIKGCIDTSYAIKIDVGKIPFPDFSVSKTSLCPDEEVTFTDKTPLSDSIDTWHYYSDGKGFMTSHCPNDGNPTWKFISSTGPQNVELEVGSKGCYNSITKNSLIWVKGPIITFTTQSYCDSPQVYIFTAAPQQSKIWSWNFGDGTNLNNTTQAIVSHKYINSGNYTVTLKAENDTTGCNPWTDTKIAEVRKLKAFFTPDTLLCNNVINPFNSIGSTDVDVSCDNSGYIWFFDNEPPKMTSSTNTNQIFTNSGYHNIKLVVKDVNYCWDTISKRVKSFGVFPKIVCDSTYICVPQDVIFYTKGTTADTTITSYNWNFGDGGTSTIDSISHLYTNTAPNSFIVTLTITDKLGCSSTANYTIIPSKPNPNFSATPKLNLCVGDSVRFNPVVTTHEKYSWNFGDGKTDTIINPYHKYINSGTYSVNLKINDSINCPSQSTISNYIHVQDYPNPNFYSSLDTAANRCYPKDINFIDTANRYKNYVSRIWDLGTGGATISNASVYQHYGEPGKYTVKLYLTTTFGCKDSSLKTFQLYGPKANFNVTPSSVCKGDSVLISLNTSDTFNLDTWHWDFGDGTGANKSNPIYHIFNYHPSNGNNNITLICWSQDSTCPKTFSKPLKVHQVIADFKRNNEISSIDTAHCLNITDNFINTSDSANTYYWNFGDSYTDNTFNTQHKYKSAGTYNVELLVKNTATTCEDTITKKMIIFPLPEIIASGGDTCFNKSVQIFSNANNAIKYKWTPSTGLSSDTIANPYASPKTSTNYQIKVTDINGCTDSKNVYVYIQQPPNEIIWDTTIVVGEKVNLNGNAGDGFTYSWNPPKDLSCPDCPVPNSSTLQDIKYVVTFRDTLGCFTGESIFTIKVLPVSSVDVPSAFTPNGDGINDIAYVAGWGIKKLISFKIFNRWGELLFESNDIKVGWDGKYKGTPQNTETYTYYVIAETYIDKEPITKKGLIKILR